ncbi:MAG: 3-isopropylmalate dehydrogenase [Pseudomonadota bacterium]
MRIAVLPGDGIGPEIVAQAVKVLEALNLNMQLDHAPIGGAGYEAAGDPLPAETLALAKQADAVLLGAVGDWKYDSLPRDMRPERGLLRIRKELNLFANLRPALLYPELASASTLKPEVVSGLDIMIVRELTGDIYFGQPRGISTLANGEREGINTMRYSESEIRRIAHIAFSIAMKRNEDAYLAALKSFSEPARKCWEVIWIDGDEYQMTFKSDDSLYRYWNATACVEFGLEMAKQALEKDLKEETEFLAKYDLVYRAIDGQYDIRGKDLNTLILACMEQNGRISINRRKKFATTVQEEVFDAIEAAYLKLGI